MKQTVKFSLTKIVVAILCVISLLLSVNSLVASNNFNYAHATETGTPQEISIVWAEDNFTYNGKDQKSSVTAYYLDKNSQKVNLAVTTSSEFKNYNKDGYVFTAAFANGETEYKLPSEVTKVYFIKKLDVSNAKVEIKDEGDFTYNGKEHNPSVVSVKVGDIVLNEDVDYSVIGAIGAIVINEYTLKVIGEGNFTGEKVVSWNIKQPNLGTIIIALLGVIVAVEIILTIVFIVKIKKKGGKAGKATGGIIAACLSLLLLKGSYFEKDTIIAMSILGAVVVGGLVLNIVLGAKLKKISNQKLTEEQVTDEKAEEQLEEKVEPVQEVAEENKEPVEQVKDEQVVDEIVDTEQIAEAEKENEAAVADSQADGDDSAFVFKDGQKVMVRYNRSFTAKLVQSKDQTKEFYATIKNYLLSFKGVKCRISWKAATFNLGRKQLAKLTIKGKTLNIYLALDPDNYSEVKFTITDVGESATYANVPLSYKVKSNRGVNNAVKLIDDLMKDLGLEKIENTDITSAKDYPYEDTKALIVKGLIKVKSTDGQEITDIDNVVTQPFELDKVNSEATVISFQDGREIVARYNRSFMAKLIQTKDQTKEYYCSVKNYLLSFKGVKSRISWKADSFNVGRKQVAKLTIKGKTLNIYLALNPTDYADAKFNVTDMGESKTYAAVPLSYKIKSNRGVNYACGMIDTLMASLELFKAENKQPVSVGDYPFEENQSLIEKDLIKLK